MSTLLRIVVADDEQDMRSYFEKLLPRLGYELVGVAANGRELVDLCRQSQPDLIISDVRMPELDGDKAIEQICREFPCPFILVSAFSPPPRNVLDQFHVAWCYLHKPVKRADLEAAISAVVAQAGDKQAGEP